MDLQMRAANDTEHMRLLNEMRNENPDMKWVVRQLETKYHTLNAQLLERDPEFAFSAIAVTGNRERAVINDVMSQLFATYHN